MNGWSDGKEAGGLKLFVSYSHKDEAFREDLETHFTMLMRQGKISVWNDRKILPGGNIDNNIDIHLADSDIVIFLISPDFIRSEYCFSKELSDALDLHEEGRVQVVPIIIRPCDWMEAPFARLRVLPKDGLAITKWAPQEDGWLDVIGGLKPLIDSLLERRRSVLENSITTKPLTIREHLYSEINRVERVFTEGKACTGTSTGIDQLDDAIDGIHPGQLILVAGRPQSGKASLLLMMAASIAVSQKRPALYFSQKGSASAVIQRLVSSLGYIRRDSLAQGRLSEEDWPRLTSTFSYLADAALFISDNAGETIASICASVRNGYRERGIEFVFLDGIEHVRRDGQEIEKFAEVAAITLKNLARELGISIVASCITSRDSEARPNRRPVVNDLSGWHSLFDSSDVAILTFRDVYGENFERAFPEVELLIAKNPIGPIRMLRVPYDLSTGAFMPVDPHIDE